MAERKVLKMKGVESGVLSAVSVEAEGEGVEIGLLGAVCIAVKGEGEAVVMGVLGAVSVCIRVGAEGEGVELGVLFAVTVCCIAVVALPLAFLTSLLCILCRHLA